MIQVSKCNLKVHDCNHISEPGQFNKRHDVFAYLNAIVKIRVYFMLHDYLSLVCKKP